ncbi:MAG TPA: hypothetical protein VK997_14425, partial [Deferrisomatales bacterium]|nr:hypothetical protein [Deferrisomatales bacterium]
MKVKPMLAAECSDGLMASLAEAVPLIARVTAGFAGVAALDGTVLLQMDEEGRESSQPLPGVSELIRDAAAEGRCVSRTSPLPVGGSSWALPVGSCVLFASNSARVSRELELKSCLEMALPLIAKVAGGEAVIFNRSGARVLSVLPNGRQHTEMSGKVFETCRRTMESGRPDVGPSRSVPGAVAVRIPITRDFGFG